MRTTDHIEQFRLPPEKDKRSGTTKDDGMNGVFQIPFADDPKIQFFCIVSDGTDDRIKIEWEHVSVMARSKNASGKWCERVPNWREMCWIKGVFWSGKECVVQYHPKESNYVNIHENVLHLWRWTGGEFPQPPKICV